jgi:hypothetical protein
MNYYFQLGLEALLVGVVFILLFFISEKLGFDNKKYSTVFGIAVMGHLLFELSGVNKIYCEKRCILFET